MRGTREAILTAAMELFSRKGYAGCSIREICADAGITKPVLYYHFRNKGHLFEELMVDSFSYYLKALLRSSKSKGSLRHRLIHITYNDLRAARANPARIRFMLRMAFAPEAERPYFNLVEEMEKERQVIAGVLRDGIAAGEANGDALHLATALMGINLITIFENLFTGRPALTRRTAEKSVDILLHQSDGEESH